MASDQPLAQNVSPLAPSLRPLRSEERLRVYGTWATALVIGALALALTTYRLGAQSLWLDEGSTWAEVTGRTGKQWAGLVAELWSSDAAYPLYHLLLKGWVALAGDTEWALRFPSALAGGLAAVVLYLAALELRRSAVEQDAGVERTADREISRQACPERRRRGDRGAAVSATGLRFRLREALSSGALAGIVIATSPYALWYAQEAKAYSLLILAISALLWGLLRALHRQSRGAWLATLLIAVVSLFVHRLALLALSGVALAAALACSPLWRVTGDLPAAGTKRLDLRPWLFVLVAFVLAAAGVAGTVLAVTNERRGGGHVAAGPLPGAWLSLAHFATGRGTIDGLLNVPLLVWTLPALVLTLWGVLLLAFDAPRGNRRAAAVLLVLVIPLALFAGSLALAPVFEARYAAVAFPAWVLVVTYPLLRRPGESSPESRAQEHRRTAEQGRRGGRAIPVIARAVGARHALGWAFVSALVLVNLAALLQPQHGQFSGAPVKEQWREAITEVARRVHPDDLLILHPYYVLPLWDYYAPRVTPDTLPQPATFAFFAEGDCAERYAGDLPEIRRCVQRNYEPYFNQRANGKKRMLLLIAPDHARTVDPPKTLEELRSEAPADKPALEGDRYGWLGLRFLYPQKTWPCGGTGDAYIGVEIMCQSFPETFNAGGPGAVPQPQVVLPATFGAEVQLRGYTLPAGAGARPGGTLPVTLFWAAERPPSHDYTMFLHLCRDCTAPPVAQDDRPPLDGYPPAGRTTTWRVGDPLHDERAIYIPRDLQPGRYTLVLGVYPAGDPAIDSRLAVGSAAPVLDGRRLVLGEVTVLPGGQVMGDG